MPNWVTNIIKVEKNIDEFKKRFIDKDGNFDFNKVIPMPKDLEISSGTYSYQYLENEQIKKLITETYNTTDTQKEFVDKVLEKVKENNLLPISELEEANKRELDKVTCQAEGYFNLQRYGYEDWYSWSIDKWGTKWNACHTYIVEDCALYIIFDTAWAMPEFILQEMAKDFDFTCVYADEDIGYNLGIFVAKDGHFFDTEFKNVNTYFTAICIKNNTISDKEYLHELINDYGIEVTDNEFDKVVETLTPYLP